MVVESKVESRFEKVEAKIGPGNYSKLSRLMRRRDGTRWSRVYLTRVLSGKRPITTIEMLDELVKVAGLCEADIKWYLALQRKSVID